MQNLHRLAPLLALPLLLSAPGQETDAPPDTHGLEWQLGTWQGTRRDAADGSEGAMTLRARPVLDGAGLTFEMEIVHDGGTYRGFSVQVFDPEEELWRRRYVNDVRRTFASLEGKPEGERTLWRSVTPGRSRESRLVSERPEPDRWVRTMTISEDDGQTWRELWIDELERKD